MRAWSSDEAMMFGDPEGESGNEMRPPCELAKGGSERPVSRPTRPVEVRSRGRLNRDAGPPNRAVSRPWAARSRLGALGRSRGLRDGRFFYLLLAS